MFKAEHSGRKKARAMLNRTGYSTGGHVKTNIGGSVGASLAHKATGGEVAAPAPAKLKTGGTVMGGTGSVRLDKAARGGGMKRHKGHTTNVVVAMPNPQPHPVPVPVPMGGGHPPMGGGAPGGAPPMPPPGAGPGMAAGAGSLPGGAPGMGMKPAGLKRGGPVKAGFKYPIDDGSGGGEARKEKARAYGSGALK